MPAPDKLTIDTPEHIALEFTVATLGSRFLALAADTLAQIGGAAVVLATAGLVRLATGPWPGGIVPWVLGVLLLILFTIYYGYFAWFEARWAGQTPGKRLVGLRTIHTSGRPITASEAILRNLVRVADQVPGIYAVGILAVFFTARSQRLGDLAADTLVVHEQAAGPLRPRQAAGARPGTRYGAARLTAEEVVVIEAFLRRRDELFGVRELRARQVADRVRGRLGLGADEPDEVFLEHVLTEYRDVGRYR